MPFPLSPLDGRYASKVSPLAEVFSEFGLAKYRTQVEIAWLEFLGEEKIFPCLDSTTKKKLATLSKNFGEKDFAAIKKIEEVTNHDVKAVEMYLRKFVPEKFWSQIHFGCTSEDINSTAYGLMLRDGLEKTLDFLFEEIFTDLKKKCLAWKSVPMLARTHGQPATPTTVGKEFLVFLFRAEQEACMLESILPTAKFSGATGNFAAHSVAFPEKKWIQLSQKFVEQKLGLSWSPLTTQIDPHDSQVAVLDEMAHVSSIFIGMCRDIWGYISLGYFGQKVVKGEVGSSTMPHKVNPIDFENAEGNLKLARGIAHTLADELPISRWQRDLTDSTLQRNFGLVFGHFFLALQSLKKGLGKLELRQDVVKKDLMQTPEVLTEAVQTVMRKYGDSAAYEKLKTFSRGHALSLEEIRKFIDQTKLPADEKKKLKALTPEKYTGLSQKLVEEFLK